MATGEKSVRLSILGDNAKAKAAIDEIEARGEELKTAFPELQIGIDKASTLEQLRVLQAEMRAAAENLQLKAILEDTDAKARLDDLKAKVDALNQKRATLWAGVDDKDAQARIASINARFDELSRKSANPRVALDGYEKVLAEIASMDAELDKFGSKRVTATAAVNSGGALAGPWQMWAAAIAGVGAALPAIPGALAAVGSSAGVAGLAIGGISKALQDASSASSAAGESSAQLAATETANAIAIANAQQAIADAKTTMAHDAITADESVANAAQSLADAERQAANDAITSAESIASAERSLQQAEQSETNAQQALTLARQQAVLTIRDLNNQQVDGALNAQQAALNLASAQQQQQQTDASAVSTALQRQQAALSVAEAQQALVEANQHAADATNAANTANSQGVDGLPAVVSAQQQYEQAVNGVASAQQALADASRNAANQQQSDAERVANAQQALADAQRNASWQQQKDAEAVQNAIKNLANTYKQQQEAAAVAQQSSGSAANAFAKDMASMSASGRALVNQILGMKGDLKTLENAALDAIAPGVTTFLKGIQSLMPLVTGEVTSMGKLMSGAFAEAGKALESSGVQKDLRMIFDEGNKLFTILTPAIGNFLGALLDMGAKGGADVTGLGNGIAAIIDGFGKMFGALAQGAPAFGQIFQTLGRVIGSLGQPLGLIITLIGVTLAPLFKSLEPIVIGLVNSLSPALQQLIPPFGQIATAVGKVLLALVPLVPPIAQLIVDSAKFTAAIAPLIVVLVNIASIAVALASILLGVFLNAVTKPIGQIVSLVSKGVDWITNMTNLKNAGNDLANWLGQAWDKISSTAGKAIDIVVNYFKQLPGSIMSILNGLANETERAGENIVIGIYNGIVRQFNNLIGDVTNLAHTLANAIGSPFGIHFSEPSEAVLMRKAGENVARDFGKGISSGASSVNAAIHQIVSVGSGSQSGLIGASGANALKVQLDWGPNSDQDIISAFKKAIRVRGGDPTVLGR